MSSFAAPSGFAVPGVTIGSAWRAASAAAKGASVALLSAMLKQARESCLCARSLGHRSCDLTRRLETSYLQSCETVMSNVSSFRICEMMNNDVNFSF